MDFKLIGSILLIVGTSIGAGMLALPIATAQVGFMGAVLQLIFCWLIMTLSAFLILEVNLRLPQNSNLITMAGATIGPFGQVLSWLTYLLLLYSLLCAYIAGGSDLFHSFLKSVGFSYSLSPTTTTILFTLILGIIVFYGIRAVDYANRGLMLIKFIAFFLLIFLLAPHVTPEKLSAGNLQHITSATALTVTITSFGFSPIVPSLRVYFAGNIRKLKIAVLIGSIIPLICYIAWDAVIMGVLPLHGDNGLVAILHSNNQTSELVRTLTSAVQTNQIAFSTKLFTAVCMVTSFLGVSLCLTDFLADGLSMEKKGLNNFFINILTFLPPIAIVVFFPNVFVSALEYAGIYCIILLILLPTWMAWCGRYRMKEGVKTIYAAQPPAQPATFKVIGGKPMLMLLIVFAMIMLIWGVIGG